MRPILATFLVLPLLGCGRGQARPPLTVLLTDDILSLDPNQEVEAVTDSVLCNVFEPLVGFDENLQVRPVLAQAWEHPSPERWRFRLRPKVRFHDGTPLDAQAVKEALTALRGAPQLEASQWLSQVASVEVASEDTIDIVTREPRALLASMAGLYITKRNAPGRFPPLLGTGPYTVKEWTARSRVVLESWPHYWSAAPEFRIVHFEPEADNGNRLRRLVEDKADIAYGMPPALAVAQQAGVRFVRRTGLTVFYLGFDLRPRRGNPYVDPRVRRAFHLALDREGMVRDLLNGTGGVPSQPIAPLVFGFDPDLPPPRYDPEEARRLLAAAGHGRGFRSRLDYPAARHPLALRVQSDLRRIGVEVELNGLLKDEMFRLAESGASEIFLAGWDCSSGEASELYEMLLHTPTAAYGQLNYGQYSNPEVDRIAEGNSAVLNQRERKALLQRAAAIVMSDLPILPLHLEDDIYAVREGLTFVARADSEIRLSDVRSARR